MRKVGKLISSLLLLFIMLVSLPLPVDAEAYKTYSQAPSGDLVETQTAYEAYDILYSSLMTSPEDIVIRDSIIYTVDSQQRHVLIMDINGEVLDSFGEDILSAPTGIALDSSNDIYVADGSAGRVFKFSETGELLDEFARPEEPLFGRTSPYTPRKISVDIRGNMYIIGEGATAGVIQLNPDGEFLGYYGANEAPTNFLQIIRDNLLSEIQQARVFRNVPPASTNIDIDDKGSVYTVTNSSQSEAVKKLNVAGANIFWPGMYQPEGAIDVATGLYDNFYVLTNQGQIIEYSLYGDILFTFGMRDSGSQRLGVYNSPSAIGVDEFGTLYVVDSEAQLIHKLRPTEFADGMHSGLILFQDGRYIDSTDYWQNVINMNPSIGIARFALGESYFQRQEYGRALDAFRTAEAIPAYSNAFWEIRNDWFQRNLGMLLFVVIVFFIVLKIVNSLFRRKYDKTPWQILREKSRKIKTLRELGYVFRMFRHPFDTLYEIQNMNRSSVKAASILYAVLLIQFIMFNYVTGYIFNYRLLDTYNIIMLVLIFIVAFLLLISMNYMIATITEGEGSLKDVYMGVAYSFAPVLVGIIPVILISNILTLNEAFLFHFPLQVMLVYTFVHLVIMIKEMHDFDGWKVVQNILLTLFASLVTIVVLYIMYILFVNLYDFIYSLIMEVLARV